MVAATTRHGTRPYCVLDNLMPCIVVRCANGVVVWVRVPTGRHTARWQCTRDGFSVQAPSDPAGIEAVLQALAMHSVSLSGAILQVVQLQV